MLNGNRLVPDIIELHTGITHITYSANSTGNQSQDTADTTLMRLQPPISHGAQSNVNAKQEQKAGPDIGEWTKLPNGRVVEGFTDDQMSEMRYGEFYDKYAHKGR